MGRMAETAALGVELWNDSCALNELADAVAAGFCELCVDAKVLADMGKSPLKVESGLLREECADLFAQWLKSGKARAY